MSTAFRNFIITFALAAALFGVVGYLALGGLFDGFLNGEDDKSEVSYDYSYGDVEYYYNLDNVGTSGEISNPEAASDVCKAYAVFCENQNKELVSAKVIFTNSQTGKIISETLPIDSSMLVNGYNSTIKDIYSSNGEEFLCGKLGYVFGVSFDGFMSFDVASIKKIFFDTQICTDYQIAVSCTVPFEIKYDKKGYEDYNKEHPDDAQMETIAGKYNITYKTGDKVVLSSDAKHLFENIPKEGENAEVASDMVKEIFGSLSTKIFSNQSIKGNTADIEKIINVLKKCTIDSTDFEAVFNGYSTNAVSFPALSQLSGRDLPWEKLPKELETLLVA